jgi:hypothetical protein
MHPASTATFQALRSKFESQWAPQMMANLGIDTALPPIIWEAIFYSRKPALIIEL